MAAPIMNPDLSALARIFGTLSMLAFGGGNSVLPEMQRQMVDVHHWMSAQDFSALFALAQAAPGPNMMIVPLLGWHVAGWQGLLVSSIAKFLPSALLTIVVMRLWSRFKEAPWRRAVQAGLAPMTVGLVASSAALMTQASDGTWGLAAITFCSALLTLRFRLHPLWVLAGSGLAGFLGLAVL
jgi:chromate transporter